MTQTITLSNVLANVFPAIDAINDLNVAPLMSPKILIDNQSFVQIAFIESDNIEHQLMLFRLFLADKKFFSFTFTLFVHTNETESGM